MKLKQIFSIALISLSTASFASALLPITTPSIQMMSKLKPSSSDFCYTFLHMLSESCINQTGDVDMCSDLSLLDRTLRSVVASKGGVENFCQGSQDVPSCITVLNRYMNYCPTLRSI